MANFRKSQEASLGVKAFPFEVPQWPLVDDVGTPLADNGKPNCTHYVRMMTMGELRAFHEITLPILNTDQVRCGQELLARTMSDDQGNRLYQDSEVALFDKMDWSACRLAIAAARTFNGLEEATVKNS